MVSLLKQDNAFSQAWNTLNTSGGLKIYTTLSAQDERAAKQAVNYMVPQPPNGANPGGNADSEVLIQPGSGHILAIANDRSYGTGKNQTTEDYAVNSQYDGGVGVQTGSSSKLFTLLTALEQGVPFGFAQTVQTPATLSGYTNCKGEPIVTPYQLVNDSPSEKGAFTLYNATAQSVNVYFAMLERKVGLCNVVKTAVALGVTRADGQSLLKWDHGQPPADDLPSFTLGSVNVSPMSMAAAYATVAARGMYCTPVAVARIITGTGARLPVAEAALPSGHPGRCRRRGQLRPAERADRRDRGRAWASGARPQARPARRTILTSPPSVATPRTWPATCPCSTPPTRSSSRCQASRLLLPARLPRRDVRRRRARAHLADDVPAREPGQPGPGLRHGRHSRVSSGRWAPA